MINYSRRLALHALGLSLKEPKLGLPPSPYCPPILFFPTPGDSFSLFFFLLPPSFLLLAVDFFSPALFSRNLNALQSLPDLCNPFLVCFYLLGVCIIHNTCYNIYNNISKKSQNTSLLVLCLFLIRGGVFNYLFIYPCIVQTHFS